MAGEMKWKYRFKLVDALLLSTLIHTVGIMGIPNSCRFSKPQSKPFKIELVEGTPTEEKKDLTEGLEEFVEHIPGLRRGPRGGGRLLDGDSPARNDGPIRPSESAAAHSTWRVLSA